MRPNFRIQLMKCEAAEQRSSHQLSASGNSRTTLILETQEGAKCNVRQMVSD